MCDGAKAGSLRISNFGLAQWVAFNRERSLNTSFGFEPDPLTTKEINSDDCVFAWVKELKSSHSTGDYFFPSEETSSD